MTNCKHKQILDEVKSLIHPLFASVVQDDKPKALGLLTQIEKIVNEVKDAPKN